jgi:hypothetical protein
VIQVNAGGNMTRRTEVDGLRTGVRQQHAEDSGSRRTRPQSHDENPPAAGGLSITSEPLLAGSETDA